MCPQNNPIFKVGWGRSIARALRSEPGTFLRAIFMGGPRQESRAGAWLGGRTEGQQPFAGVCGVPSLPSYLL